MFGGKRVTIMGLGTRGGGTGAARFLAERGAIVTVTDGQTEAALADSIEELSDLSIRFVLGQHEERDFTPDGADMVVRNPAVRSWSPFLKLARESGVPVEMEMTIFFRLCPAPIIGITGTKGKTSTAAICAAILKEWRSDTALLGNMGVSAVGHLDHIDADTPVVIEISSWQLEGLDEHRLAPHIAVLTNIAEDHLDTYNDYEHYAATKRTISLHLSSGDVFVVNRGDPRAWMASDETSGQVLPFDVGLAEPGVSIGEDRIDWSFRSASGGVVLPDTYALQGGYQLRNAAAAIGAAIARGADQSAVERGLAGYRGVRDRREMVAEIDGIRFVNDSSATAPAAAIAVLQSFGEARVHVIAGGSDKGVDLVELAHALADRASTVTLLDGTATPTLRTLLRDRGIEISEPAGSMREAVSFASRDARAGDVVLLSPGCASFGLFKDEFDRGEQFRREVYRRRSDPK